MRDTDSEADNQSGKKLIVIILLLIALFWLFGSHRIESRITIRLQRAHEIAEVCLRMRA
jgi:hypothetical protein